MTHVNKCANLFLAEVLGVSAALLDPFGQLLDWCSDVSRRVRIGRHTFRNHKKTLGALRRTEKYCVVLAARRAFYRAADRRVAKSKWFGRFCSVSPDASSHFDKSSSISIETNKKLRFLAQFSFLRTFSLKEEN